MQATIKNKLVLFTAVYLTFSVFCFAKPNTIETVKDQANSTLAKNFTNSNQTGSNFTANLSEIFNLTNVSLNANTSISLNTTLTLLTNLTTLSTDVTLNSTNILNLTNTTTSTQVTTKTSFNEKTIVSMSTRSTIETEKTTNVFNNIPKIRIQQNLISRSQEDESGSFSFLKYFLIISTICVVIYVVYHNKSKVKQ